MEARDYHHGYREYEINEEKAIHLYKQAIKHGNDYSYEELGRIYYSRFLDDGFREHGEQAIRHGHSAYTDLAEI